MRWSVLALLLGATGCGNRAFGDLPEARWGGAPPDAVMFGVSGKAGLAHAGILDADQNHEYLWTSEESGLRSLASRFARQIDGDVMALGYSAHLGEHVSPVTGRIEPGLAELVRDLGLAARKWPCAARLAICHSHGCMIARRALALVDVTVDVLVDLDGVPLWFAVDHGEPPGGYAVPMTHDGTLALSDWVPSSVHVNLELLATMDADANQRRDGTRRGITTYQTSWSHAALWRDPRVADLILDSFDDMGVVERVRDEVRCRPTPRRAK